MSIKNCHNNFFEVFSQSGLFTENWTFEFISNHRNKSSQNSQILSDARDNSCKMQQFFSHVKSLTIIICLLCNMYILRLGDIWWILGYWMLWILRLLWGHFEFFLRPATYVKICPGVFLKTCDSVKEGIGISNLLMVTFIIPEIRDVFMTLSNISDGAFLRKYLMTFSSQLFLHKQL